MGPAEDAISAGLASRDPDRLWQSDTIAGCLANMTITAPRWLFTAAGPMQWRPPDAGTWRGWSKMMLWRGVYLASLLLLAAFWLAVAALGGAMICRISALEFAGAEQPSLSHAWRFATRRFWNFINAPAMPFALVLVVGVAMALIGVLGAVPWIGERRWESRSWWCWWGDWW